MEDITFFEDNTVYTCKHCGDGLDELGYCINEQCPFWSISQFTDIDEEPLDREYIDEL